MTRLCAALFIALLILTQPIPAQTRTGSPYYLIGNRAPNFDLPVLDGKMFDGREQQLTRRVSRAGLKGKIVILNFFSTWCGPCKAEHPALLSLRRAYAPRGVEVFGVLTQDSKENGRRHLVGEGRGIPILVQDNNRLAEEFQTGRGVPVTFVLDRGGIVRKVRQGGPVSYAELAAAVDSLLAKK